MKRLPLSRRLLVIPPVAIGVVVLMLMVASRSEPTRTDLAERAVPARVITVRATELIPRAIGHGTARPATTWEGVAEVQGRLVEVNPLLEEGEVITAGAVLVRIDPTDYQLAIADRRAQIAEVDASLAELVVSEANTQASLAIERRALELSENELERQRGLLERETISTSIFEEQERQTLTQRNQVQSLENELGLIPTRRQSLQAQRDRIVAQLEQAQLDLAHTTITSPIEGRVATVNAEVDQFVNLGQALAELDGIDVTEIPAQFLGAHARHLILASGVDHLPVGTSIESVIEQFGLSAVVRVSLGGDFVVQWDARVVRASPQFDPQTRTLGLIVAVDDPYRQAIPGERPPLTRGMYCEVELRGQTIPDAVVIPRSALHGDVVYVLGEDSRLERRRVEVAFHQSDLTALRSGLEPGEQVVVTDLIPAIEGMLIDAREDSALSARLLEQASGGERIEN